MLSEFEKFDGREDSEIVPGSIPDENREEDYEEGDDDYDDLDDEDSDSNDDEDDEEDE